MLLFDGAAGVILLALWLFCLVDVVVSDEYACRNLPKMVWLLIVLILPDVGSLLWLILGRPQGARLPGSANRARHRGDRVGYAATGDRPVNPDDDEAFLQQVRIRAEQQRRLAREQQQADTQAHDQDQPPRPHGGSAPDDPVSGRD